MEFFATFMPALKAAETARGRAYTWMATHTDAGTWDEFAREVARVKGVTVDNAKVNKLAGAVQAITA
jgi:hypothetical protein